MTTDEEKSEARAYLSAFADNMPDKKTSMMICQTIMTGGEANFKEHVDRLLHAVYLLRDEFAAWGEVGRSYDIGFFADMAKDFDDAFRQKFLDGGSDVIKLLVCHTIKSVFLLRKDLSAWGKRDRERITEEL